MKKGKLFLFIFLAMFAQSCLLKYVPPKEGEDAAIVKLKYTYSKFVPNTSLLVGLQIKEDDKKLFSDGYSRNYGYIGNEPIELEMETLRVHPGKQAIINMYLQFYWTTHRQVQQTSYVNGQTQTRWVTVTDQHYRGCSDAIVLTPEKDKIYLLDYTNPNIDNGCSLISYEQQILSDGKFKLKPVGEKYLAK